MTDAKLLQKLIDRKWCFAYRTYESQRERWFVEVLDKKGKEWHYATGAKLSTAIRRLEEILADREKEMAR